MHFELLDRYLTGKCTNAERASVEAWLAEVPGRRALVELLTAANDPIPEALKTEVRARLEREMDRGLRLGGNDV
jgi:hypothetical protein